MWKHRSAFEGWGITNSAVLVENKQTHEISEEMFREAEEASVLNNLIPENLLEVLCREMSHRGASQTLMYIQITGDTY